ncbi:hypothetical protein CHARACLAT_025818 [Characodon lateralis]|uniref:Uncharacterized protein n=1 Tax=Characodon lateralis TaxID=208331 RepID=A0ABU7DU79_9TELE|nr:hypothetical protein [Characodon lateralis]
MASASVLPSQIGPYKLYYFDLGRTTPGNELEIKLINAYMKMLERQHNNCSAEKVLCIDSFTMTAVWQKTFSCFKIIYQRKPLLLDSLGEIAQKTKKCQYQEPSQGNKA